MKIDLIKPYAFCPGVQNAINNTFKIIKNNPNSNVYLIGNIIHNDIVCNQIKAFKNVTILDDKCSSRIALVNSIKTKNNVLIFSAHGTHPKAIEIAIKKGYEVHDLVCPYVNKILKQIKTKIEQGYAIAYYGIKTHPEARAAKATGGSNLVIYQNKKDVTSLLKKNKVCVVCQTTMDRNKYLATKCYFAKVKNLEFNDLICISSKTRQDKALNTRPYDITLVISDPTSHNGQSLYEVLKSKQKNVYLIDPNKPKLNKTMFKNKKDCAIFSSSSVSIDQVNNIVNKIKLI